MRESERERWKKTYDVGRGRGRRDGIREVGSVGRSHPCSHQNGESLSIDSHSFPLIITLYATTKTKATTSPFDRQHLRFAHVPWALEK